MNFFDRLRQQAADFWAGLGTARRLLLAAVAAGLVLAVAAVVLLNQSAVAGYTPLYANLPLDESAAIDARLTAAAIPHKLEAGGATVSVPADQHARARVTLAADNLPSGGGKGYELFDTTSLGMTPFVQSVNYQRALQSELARSIAQIEPVSSARVMVARPEPTPFVRDQKPPTASVVLKLKPGMALTKPQATSIVSLVARSVEGLRPENVTVVDSAGRLLSDPHAGEKDDLPGGALDYRRALEADLAQKAEEMLARHLGAGRAVVRVTADVNTQKVKERRESYSPEDKAIAAERLTTTKSTTPSSRGVTGVTSNVQRAGGTQGGGVGTSNEEVVQTDYLVSKTTRDLEDRNGAIQRLTVAAMVDLSPVEGAPAGPTISETDAADLIKQAVGFRTGRDEFKLSNVRLAGPPAPPEPDTSADQIKKLRSYAELAMYVCGAVAVGLTLLALALLLVRRRPRLTPPAEPTAEQRAADDARRQAEERRAQLMERFADMARNDPNRFAKVFGMMVGQGQTPAQPTRGE